MSRAVVLSSLLAITASVGASAKKPHILFVVADDLGYTDLGFKGSEIKTPVIDSIATKGRPLTSYYVQPSCSPSRAAFHTGRYPSRFRIDIANIGAFDEPRGVPLNETFLPELLKNTGYRTHAIGKWHLGGSSWEFTPTFRGYETYLGMLQGAGSYFTHLFPWFVPPKLNRLVVDVLDPILEKAAKGGAGVSPNSYDMFRQVSEHCGKDCAEAVLSANNYYSTHLYAEEAVRLIEEHDPATPFFLYLAFQACHGPNQAPRSYVEPYDFITDKKRRIYAGMLAALDEAVGNVTQALRDRGMWEDTIVVLTTDNGGPTETCEVNGSRNKGLKGGKCSLWEGGTRAESFVGGPALKLSEDVAGTPMKQLMHGVDWLPTLAEAVGLDLAEPLTQLPLDGVSQWKNLLGQETEVRNEIFYGYEDNNRNGAAIRDARWKLIRGTVQPFAKLNLIPGINPLCTPNCVNCSATTGYDWLDQECPKDVPSEHSSPRRLTEMALPVLAKKEKEIRLFDLSVDEAETTDVSAEEPEVLQHLISRLDYWEGETYLSPDVDPAFTPGCPKQPAFPNHDGPRRVPIGYPWCELSAGAALV